MVVKQTKGSVRSSPPSPLTGSKELEGLMANDMTRNLILAHEFIGEEWSPDSILVLCDTVKRVFPKVEEKAIVKALYNGYTGAYGKTYKLTTQEVCIWVRCLVNNCKPADLSKTQGRDYFAELKRGIVNNF